MGSKMSESPVEGKLSCWVEGWEVYKEDKEDGESKGKKEEERKQWEKEGREMKRGGYNDKEVKGRTRKGRIG